MPSPPRERRRRRRRRRRRSHGPGLSGALWLRNVKPQVGGAALKCMGKGLRKETASCNYLSVSHRLRAFSWRFAPLQQHPPALAAHPWPRCCALPKGIWNRLTRARLQQAAVTFVTFSARRRQPAWCFCWLLLVNHSCANTLPTPFILRWQTARLPPLGH